MVVQYQGQQKGIPTKFTVRINRNNILKNGSKYRMDLLVGEKQLPSFKTLNHKSLSDCLKEMYLFRKFNNIELEASSEKVEPTFIPSDSILYNNYKQTLFMA
ncbi:hypothetical protein AB3G33_08850 [Flavobacterium sp. WC2421]|jgi:hypothetical protein|uniref:hypothetical protein n=1 Tax=Flavobacterium sp. WC2421 TaxID=3234138 RepID=UPI003466E8C1